MVHIRDPILDPGTPEEEAMRYRCLPLSTQVHRYQNWRDSLGAKYHYYNHPEGEDLLGKLVHLNSLLIRPVLFFGVFDAVMISKQKTPFTFVARLGHFMLPALGCATAFGTGAYVANKIRGKDDFGNWVVGTLAAGSVVGKWARSGLWGWNAFFLFTLVAGAQRIAHHEGWKFFHEFETREYTDLRDAESVRWHKISRQFGPELFNDVEKGYTTRH